jgi:hypothetical protein
MHEVALGPGKTAFSLDNQEGKLLVCVVKCWVVVGCVGCVVMYYDAVMRCDV